MSSGRSNKILQIKYDFTLEIHRQDRGRGKPLRSGCVGIILRHKSTERKTNEAVSYINMIAKEKIIYPPFFIACSYEVITLYNALANVFLPSWNRISNNANGS